MADSYQVLFGGQAAGPAFYALVSTVEVEENADLPGAVELTLPITTRDASGSEDLALLDDDRFKPYARIAVVATPDGGGDQCIFDGFVLSHRVHLDRGTTAATLRIWGQDASCKMNLEEKAKEWPSGKSDVDIAADIFNQHGFTPDDANRDEDTPKHNEDGNTLMQRATDAQFLRDRARRDGRLFRVACTDTAGQNKGYFIKPKLDASAHVTLTLHPPASANVEALDFEWDVARPTEVRAQVLLKSKDAQSGNATESGVALADSRSLAAFTGDDGKMKALLTAAADSADELKLRAQSLLREAGWFVRCEGESDLARLKGIPRVGQIVQINGAGRIHSGKYLVWSVRHTITAPAHRMRFVLVRNAVGNAS